MPDRCRASRVHVSPVGFRDSMSRRRNNHPCRRMPPLEGHRESVFCDAHGEQRWLGGKPKMRKELWLVAVALSLGCLLAAPAHAAGDAAAGRVKAQTCTGCHAIASYNNVYPTYH